MVHGSKKYYQRGNIAIMTSLLIFLLFAIGGGAVDFIRYTTIRSELQSAADSAVLAAASLTNTQPPVTVANDYFDINFDKDHFGLDAVSFLPVVEENTATRRTISASASTSIPTLFLGVLPLNAAGDRWNVLEIKVTSRATQSEQFIELALVLDISGSMAGAKIANLRTAADSFVTDMLTATASGQTSISIIPFSANVNIDPILSTYADLSGHTLPLSRPCVHYLDTDYNTNTFSGLRPPVDQTSTDARHRCAPTPVILNTDNSATLSTLIGSLTADANTDAHMGLMWGAKALSPNFQGMLGGTFPGRPRAYGSDTLKALVVMTDGNLNPQADALGIQDVPESEAQFNALCAELKNNGVIVYSIGFDITAGSAADIILQNCASNLSQYFFVEGLDVTAAFEGIAASLKNLRISE